MVCLHKQSFFVQISCYIAMITDKFGGIIDVDLQQKKDRPFGFACPSEINPIFLVHLPLLIGLVNA